MEYAGLSPWLWYSLIVLVLVGIPGVIGNIMAIVFYAKHGPDTSSTVFIIALSSVDLLLSCLVVQVDIHGAINGYYNKTKIACKTTMYLMKSVYFVSYLFLVCIALDRFRKICQPFSKQFTKAQSRWMVAVVGILGAVLSSPAAFTADLQTIKNSTSYSCVYDQTDKNSTCQCGQTEVGVLGTVYLVSTYCDVLYFILILGTIGITYTCVIIRMRQAVLTKRRQTADNSRGKRVTNIEKSLTIMSCCITVTFIACLIPYFVVELGGLRLIVDDFRNNALVEILIRSPYLSSAINPYIACFFNPLFRQLVRKLLKK